MRGQAFAVPGYPVVGSTLITVFIPRIHHRKV